MYHFTGRRTEGFELLIDMNMKNVVFYDRVICKWKTGTRTV